MILCLLLLTVITVNGFPLEGQPIKRTPLVYYTHPTPPYVSGGLYPYIQYPGYTPPLGKALQSIQSPNDLIFYPNTLAPQPLVFNPQPGRIPVAPRFTAPPNGLVDAIYAWFAENNLAVPDDPRQNEATPEKDSSAKDPEKVETPRKHEAGEAEVLAEADRNYPKKVTPNFKPGQRFYILNGQPQFFGNYQPSLPRVQPPLLSRSAFPADTQNIVYLQPGEPQPQQPEKLSKPSQDSQNRISLRNSNSETQAEPELPPQNLVLLQEAQQNAAQLNGANQQLVQNYPGQQLYLGRLLQQGQDIKSQALQQGFLQQQIQAQAPIHQTHYVPVEVVPPQVPNIHSQIQYQNQDLHRPEVSTQQLSFIHIPVDRNVQPPQYIKSIVPIQINAKTQVPQIPLIPQDLQQRNAGNILYLRAPVDTNPEIQGDEQQQQQEQQQQEQQQQEQQQQAQQQQQEQEQQNNVPPGVAALEFARYIASRQHEDIYSDSVVVDAKEETQEEATQQPEVPQQPELPEEPSVAQAQPTGIALAGIGGVASTAPRGTALVGDRGLAVASPKATAVAGPEKEKADSKPKRRYD